MSGVNARFSGCRNPGAPIQPPNTESKAGNSNSSSTIRMARFILLDTKLLHTMFLALAPLQPAPETYCHAALLFLQLPPLGAISCLSMTETAPIRAETSSPQETAHPPHTRKSKQKSARCNSNGILQLPVLCTID